MKQTKTTIHGERKIPRSRIVTFTPGPWTAEDESVNAIYIRATAKSAHELGQEIATVMNEDADDLTPRMWADARLIAAAPSLYEALKATPCRYSRTKECVAPGNRCDRCAALALVEGKQS